MGDDRTGRSRGTVIRSVILDETERAAEIGRNHNLPFLVDFLSNISLRLSVPSEAHGRRYQQEIVEHGALEVLSPYTGRPVGSAISYLLRRSIFYRFAGPPEFYVVAA